MNEFTQNSNTSRFSSTTTNTDASGYDLAAEKRRIALGTEELKKEIQDRWNRKYANAQIFPAPIAAMHPGVVDFLLSFNLVSVYDNIAKQANLDGKGRNSLSRIVWQIAQSKKWDSLDQILEAQIPLVHSAHVQVANLLKENVLNKIQVIAGKPIMGRSVAGDAVSEQSQKKEVQLPLAKALVDYPGIGEQNITINPIKLRVLPTPVRPSIKNWITDFHDVMGAKRHSPIDRGNFLFHSENGKKLTPFERQKLATILKSLDEEILLTVDTNAQRIIFGESETLSSNSDARIEKTRAIPNLTAASGFAASRTQNPGMTRGGLLQKEEESEEIFEIPGSKPPIGSQEYHTEKSFVPVDTGKTPIPAKSNQNNVYGPGGDAIVAGKNSDTLSDEELFRQLQARKTAPTEVKTGFSPNFASGSGGITFSSPQKLPAEQAVKTPAAPSLQNQAQQSVSKTTQTQAVPTPQSQRSPFRIVPSGHFHEEDAGEPKIKGNVVDLKN